MELNKIYNEDCLTGLRRLPDNVVDCVVTSPPYFALRDYGVDGQIGLEESPEAYVERLCIVFREVMRVMKPSGTLWVVIGDTYNCYRGASTRQYYDNEFAGEFKHHARPSGYGLECKNMKDKDLIGIPWMLAFALRGLGFYLRQDIIWHKPNPMPESVKSRCTKSHEYIFMLTKSPHYHFDRLALREPASTGLRPKEFNYRHTKYLVPGHQKQFRGSNRSDGMRNKRDVWSLCVKRGYGGHHATFPVELPVECIRLGSPVGGVVLDPFMGSGTTAVAAMKCACHYIGFELNKEYYKDSLRRIREVLPILPFEDNKKK